MMKFLTVFLFVCISVATNAYGYWLDVKGSDKLNSPLRIQISYGEIDDLEFARSE